MATGAFHKTHHVFWTRVGRARRLPAAEKACFWSPVDESAKRDLHGEPRAQPRDAIGIHWVQAPLVESVWRPTQAPGTACAPDAVGTSVRWCIPDRCLPTSVSPSWRSAVPGARALSLDPLLAPFTGACGAHRAPAARRDSAHHHEQAPASGPGRRRMRVLPVAEDCICAHPVAGRLPPKLWARAGRRRAARPGRARAQVCVVEMVCGAAPRGVSL